MLAGVAALQSAFSRKDQRQHFNNSGLLADLNRSRRPTIADRLILRSAAFQRLSLSSEKSADGRRTFQTSLKRTVDQMRNALLTAALHDSRIIAPSVCANTWRPAKQHAFHPANRQCHSRLHFFNQNQYWLSTSEISATPQFHHATPVKPGSRSRSMIFALEQTSHHQHAGGDITGARSSQKVTLPVAVVPPGSAALVVPGIARIIAITTHYRNVQHSGISLEIFCHTQQNAKK